MPKKKTKRTLTPEAQWKNTRCFITKGRIISIQSNIKNMGKYSPLTSIERKYLLTAETALASIVRNYDESTIKLLNIRNKSNG